MTSWLKEYDHISNQSISISSPQIGILGNVGQCKGSIINKINQDGEYPAIVTSLSEKDYAEDVFSSLDGLLFVGEESQKENNREKKWMARAIDYNIPVLAFGYSLRNLLDAILQREDSNNIEGLASSTSSAPFSLKIDNDSQLVSILSSQLLNVDIAVQLDSSKCVAPAKGVARLANGNVVGIETTHFKSILGVGWMMQPEQPETQILLKWLVEESAEFAKAKQVHNHVLSLDTHCDTPIMFNRGFSFSQCHSEVLVDAHKMRTGHLDCCIMAAYLKQESRDEHSLQEAFKRCNHLLDLIDKQVAECSMAQIALSPEDAQNLKQVGKLAIMKGIENGYAIGKDLDAIDHFQQRGVVYMTLCHNGDNDICDSALDSLQEHGGLSPFGAQVVERMNNVGMMVDLSHAAETTFYDAVEVSRLPVVCSHASTKALCNHLRNLSDDQLLTLARTGGVIQITAYPGFLRLDSQATVEDVVAHILHAVHIAGVECVGIGTDFDGDGGVPGLANASDAINLTRHLLRKHFNEDDLRLIWGGNFLRVMQQVQKVSQPFLNK